MWHQLGTVADLPVAKPKRFRVGSDAVVVVKMSESRIYAFMDMCSHQDLPLSGGSVEGESLVCPAHGAKFDLETGAPQCLPATAPIEKLPVQIANGAVSVQI